MSSRKSSYAPGSALIPLPIIGVAVSATSLEGVPQTAACLVFGVALLVCLLLAIRDARSRRG